MFIERTDIYATPHDPLCTERMVGTSEWTQLLKNVLSCQIASQRLKSMTEL